MAVVFEVEKAQCMLWNEDLLINLDNRGTGDKRISYLVGLFEFVLGIHFQM